MKIDKQIKAYTNWWPVSFEVEVTTSDIKRNSIIKVYLWKTDTETVYIDNFDVKILGVTE